LRQRDEESGDGLFWGTNLSNPSFGKQQDPAMRKRFALLGAVTLLMLVGFLGYHAISSDNEAVEQGIPEVAHFAYEVNSKSTVEIANAKVTMMKHTASGLPIMAVVPRDLTQDATFGISFRTPVEDNKGSAKIVQTSVQAGSESYPVKDPMNQLQAGSLQTHLDSWTEKDRTNFVLASRNLQDFENSVKVTLDGIFFPLLDDPNHEWIYRQEGWRLETKGPANLLWLSGYVFLCHLSYILQI
jgi:hypothetical protein